jgi:septal ring factor EnvC (AmiA/AmiB activator)
MPLNREMVQVGLNCSQIFFHYSRSPFRDGCGRNCVLFRTHGDGCVLSSRGWRLPLDRMIPRRPHRSDPRFMLGPLVALVLPYAGALAQTAPAPVPAAPGAPVRSETAAPAAPQANAETIKQRDQELDAVRADERVSAENQAKLRREIETIGEDRRALNQQLIDTAAHVRAVEASIEATRGRLRPLDAQEAALRKSLDERRSAVVEILAALQRAGHQPPPALLVQPEDALKAVRTAITLAAIVPDMRSQADALADDLGDLLTVRKAIVGEKEQLAHDLDALAREQLRMNFLVDARQKKQSQTEDALEAERARAAELARQADNLKDLIAKLESALAPAARSAHEQARSIEEDATRPALAALKDPGRLSPAVTFAAMRGHLRFPVNGAKIREFGGSDGVGGTQKGQSIAAHAGAQITAPCDGWVVYAGPFRSYGQLLILNAGGGYHVLLAGMERISVDLGQFVLTGEPVAVMGNGSQVSAAGAARSKQPVLYVEFRKDGAPIDPSPWWATNEGEKVRG